MRIICAAMLVLTFSAFAQDGTRIIHERDPQMNAAIGRAKQTLGEFLKIRESPPDNVSDFALKVLFNNEGTGEYMWVSPFSVNPDGSYSGTLKSVPQYTQKLHWGQEVGFLRSQISDWGYIKSGRRRGYFTTCALFIREPSLKQRIEADGIPYACAP